MGARVARVFVAALPLTGLCEIIFLNEGSDQMHSFYLPVEQTDALMRQLCEAYPATVHPGCAAKGAES